jgi:chromosome partitioning protein
LRSIALANHKGGVGKTTTAIHLAHGFALQGKRVVLVDLDQQGNATVALQAMESQGSLGDGALSVMRSVAEGFWLLSAEESGRCVEHGDLGRLFSQAEQAGIDVLLVDCPPRIDHRGWAGLQLCSEVLVPVQAEFFAIHGLSQMIQTLDRLASTQAAKGRLMGVLLTLVDNREPVAREVVGDLRKTLGQQVLKSVIFRDSVLVEAASHGQTAFKYDPASKGALCYGELVREVANGRSSIG